MGSQVSVTNHFIEQLHLLFQGVLEVVTALNECADERIGPTFGVVLGFVVDDRLAGLGHPDQRSSTS